MTKNLVINGAMDVAQRGASFATLIASQYTLDRWEWIDTGTTAGAVTITQDTDVPTVAQAGIKFMNSLKIDVTTAEDLGSADAALYLSHKIEAQNCTHFGHGAASAVAGRLSFWFKSTKTGIFTVNVDRNDASEKYSTEFTVGTTNTWEFFEVSIPGDTDGTAIADDNGIGLAIQFMMAVGGDGDTSTADAWNASGATELATANQVNLLDNAANNVFITGVQFEFGNITTNFERVPFVVELARCQRFYQKTFPYAQAPGEGAGFVGSLKGKGVTTNVAEPSITWQFAVEMRTTPVTTLYNPRAAGTDGEWDDGSSSSSANARAVNGGSSNTPLDNAATTLAAANGYFIHAAADIEL